MTVFRKRKKEITVGITECNLKNIFTMVFKQQYIRERGDVGYTASDLVRFMIN